MLLDLLILESLVILATMFANVSVPVVPDPNYLQQLYPQSQFLDNDNTLQAPVTQQELQTASSNTATAAQPMDVMTIINLALTTGLGYFLKTQKTSTDRRTYMAADTTVKLAANDEAADARQLRVVYAMSCMADIMGKYHREDMETYETVDGVSLWTFIENLRLSYNQDFKATYMNKGPVDTTGTQSKDKVVATFNKVQQSITPTAASPPSDILDKSPQKTRVDANKEANKKDTAAASSATT